MLLTLPKVLAIVMAFWASWVALELFVRELKAKQYKWALMMLLICLTALSVVGLGFVTPWAYQS